MCEKYEHNLLEYRAGNAVAGHAILGPYSPGSDFVRHNSPDHRSGVMYYDSVVGDLDQAGNYKLQGKVTIPSGTYYTDIHTFKVYCNLE